jgi:prevent-host-death family protein
MSDNDLEADDGEAKRAREARLIGSRTLHRHTKDVLDRVERGESVVILRYGRPAAALVPIDDERAQAIAFAGSPELRRESAEAPDAAAEPFAVAFADVETDDQSEPLVIDVDGQPVTWVIEVATSDDPVIELETMDFATLLDTQREMRSDVSGLLERIDRQARTLASLARRRTADRSQRDAGSDAGLT